MDKPRYFTSGNVIYQRGGETKDENGKVVGMSMHIPFLAVTEDHGQDVADHVAAFLCEHDPFPLEKS